jgi:excisionase family DNA binding protein
MDDIKIRHQAILTDGVYSPCEVAALLKVGTEAIYRYIRDRQIVSFRIGGGEKRPHIRVKGSDLLSFIEKRREAA